MIKKILLCAAVLACLTCNSLSAFELESTSPPPPISPPRFPELINEHGVNIQVSPCSITFEIFGHGTGMNQFEAERNANDAAWAILWDLGTAPGQPARPIYITYLGTTSVQFNGMWYAMATFKVEIDLCP